MEEQVKDKQKIRGRGIHKSIAFAPPLHSGIEAYALRFGCGSFSEAMRDLIRRGLSDSGISIEYENVSGSLCRVGGPDETEKGQENTEKVEGV